MVRQCMRWKAERGENIRVLHNMWLASKQLAHATIIIICKLVIKNEMRML